MLSQVVEDMTDLGGDFVCTLVCDKHDETVEVMKRHVITTTVLL
jgi:sulfopyruvate decarboxylase TPP-binding subunit